MIDEKKQRLIERNKSVRDYWFKIEKKNPKWKLSEVAKEVAKKYFLSERTIDAIIGREGSYK